MFDYINYTNYKNNKFFLKMFGLRALISAKFEVVELLLQMKIFLVFSASRLTLHASEKEKDRWEEMYKESFSSVLLQNLLVLLLSTPEGEVYKEFIISPAKPPDSPLFNPWRRSI